MANFSDTVKLPALGKPTVWCNILHDIYFITRVIPNFVLIFRNFRYHDNKGQYRAILNDTIKSPDPEFPLFGATF